MYMIYDRYDQTMFVLRDVQGSQAKQQNLDLRIFRSKSESYIYDLE